MYQQVLDYTLVTIFVNYEVLLALATEVEVGLDDRSVGDGLFGPRKLQFAARCEPLHLKQTCLNSHPAQNVPR